MAARKKTNAKAIIAAAKLPERSAELCLRGDLVARFQDLYRELKAAQEREKGGGSLDGGESLGLARQIDELRQEMAAHSVTFTFRGLPRTTKDPAKATWSALLAAHPPRDGDDQDKLLGLNRDTFYPALVRASLVDPVLDEDDWATLDGSLSDGQFQALVNAAWMVNARDVDVPFSPRVSQILASSAHE